MLEQLGHARSKSNSALSRALGLARNWIAVSLSENPIWAAIHSYRALLVSKSARLDRTVVFREPDFGRDSALSCALGFRERAIG